MKHLDRFDAAVNHRETDRPPADFIAQPDVMQRMALYLGAKDNEEVLTMLDVDIRHIAHEDFRLSSERDETGAFTDIWGVRRRPVTNQFGNYDEVESRPFASMTNIGQVKNYPWPSSDIYDFSTLKEQCKAYHGEYAVVFGSPGIMDLINGTSYGRGMEQLLMDIASEDPVGLALMDIRQEHDMEMAERALVAAEGMIDVLWIGDDYGTQTGPLMSVDTWKRLFGSKLKAFIDLGHKYGAKVMLHSCGSNRHLLPFWIDMGLDIYQAVQVEAADMNPAELFAEFGRDIVFHGMIGLQSVLARGTEDDVEREVERIAGLSGGSGYIIAPTHYLEIDVPMENACAIYNTVKRMR